MSSDDPYARAYSSWSDNEVIRSRVQGLADKMEDMVRDRANRLREVKGLPPLPVFSVRDPFGGPTITEQVNEYVAKVIKDQYEALETAAWDALSEGCTILVHDAPHPTRFIGIALRHGPLEIVRMTPGTSWHQWIDVMGMELQ